MFRPTLAVATASVLALGAVAAPALAAHEATPSQARAIARAVHRTPVAGLRHVPTAKYRVVKPRISSLSRSWAMASLVPTKRARGTFQSGYVFAVNLAGTHEWVVVDAGSAMVGCGIAPDSVVADLLGEKPGTQVCPPGEGIRSS